MQSIRCVSLAMVALLMAGCSSFTGQSSPELSKSARWGAVSYTHLTLPTKA